MLFPKNQHSFRWSSDENKEPCVATGKRAVKVANYYCLKRADRNECRIQFRDARPHNAGLWKLTVTKRFPFGEYNLNIRYIYVQQKVAQARIVVISTTANEESRER